MNTDQEERAAYQRAVETAKNELSDLRRRAEQAEALALTLQQQRDQAEADNAALLTALSFRHTCENCGGKGSYWVDNDGDAEHEVCDCWIEADETLKLGRPGADLLAVAEAARAYVQAGEYDDLASLLLDLKDAVARWGR